ncbi:MAG: hypothetical protein KDB58_09110 [Solirubrobacterales bacterium]|nr:hypothetical protein [Solirubrobacterales bacterium]MCB8969597.1 hypothetical protein [Thermoleophilales bacterium]MCO5327386.1 hypothetical protein [Solirubrobacterales bacterium]
MRTSTRRERTRSHGDRRIRIGRPSRRGEIPARAARRGFDVRATAGKRTLEDAVLEALDGLRTVGEATCPVCHHERMTAAGCSSCGSSLN